MLVIGGGVIGLEFATVYTRLGAKVLVVEMMPNLLTGTDLEISKTMGRILKKQGVDIALDTKVVSLEKSGSGVKAVLNGAYTGGKDETREFDVALVAVGRKPVTDGLNLEAAGVSTNERGFIDVDAQRRTKVPGIFAIGDITGAPMLAHKAMKEGVVAAEVIGGDLSSAYDPVAVPNCVYTDPEVATIGLSEEEAKAAGYELRIGKFPLVASGRARTMNESDGMIKLVGDAKTDLLLGMHIIAPQAESLIGEGVIALEMGATLEDIGLSIHPHPTLTESIMDAAEASHGKAIHILNPKPKTPALAAT
jgi:dihydrolipoamide dehydrogenase